MSFDRHAFISYAQLDNKPLTPDQRGWVTQFHATLETMLSQRLGEEARIWRDSKLTGDDVFADEIVQQFPKTALLISILSPRYLRSEWCKRELDAFCDAALKTGGVAVGNKSRIVKVVKTPLEVDSPLPAPVQRTLGYDFYSLDQEKGVPQELDPAFGDLARQQFLKKLTSLAWDLAECLHQLAQVQPTDAAAADRPRPVIFLAECGHDLRDAREHLATELQMHGYEVLPARHLSSSEEELVPELNALFERCALAVHLVGSSVGPVPDGASGISLVMLENHLAAERCRQGRLRRIIWLPEGVKGVRAEQQAFIDALQRDSALQYGADLLRGDIEGLKGAIFLAMHELEAPLAPAAIAAQGQDKRQVVHILMTEADRAACVPLIKLLRAKGLQVTIPVFVGDARSLRAANAELQSNCDAVIIFYGCGDGVWMFHKRGELRKRAVAGPGRPEWTFLAPPSTADKEMLQLLDEPNLIDALGGISDAALEPLLAALAPSRGGG